MSFQKPVIALIGGVGAQGKVVAKILAEGNKYEIRILTRSASHPAALDLAALPGVAIIEGSCYNESTLFKTFEGADFVYVNTNGGAIGPRNETYWGIRMFEIARSSGVLHFQWASLPYASKLGNYDPKFQCGHMDGKARAAEFIKQQPTSPMKWTIHTSIMYIEMLSDVFGPQPSSEDPDLFIFASPMRKAKQPMIHIDDIGRYARWIFENPERSNGMELQVATENIAWADIATTFTKVTGKKAVYQELTLEQAINFMPHKDLLMGGDLGVSDPSLLTYRQNFTGMWNSMMVEAVNPTIDYALLDEILPTRVRSLEEWMRLVGYTGNDQAVLKSVEGTVMPAQDA
ncbi:NAD(P)-binding protein [Thozetella sp. PMI_491]|nr:NAD(P)-binding protein [Thozetella sp. PMI_491]